MVVHATLPSGIPLHFRWMIRRDMPEVERIENASFEFPWNSDDFIRCLRQQNCIGKVAEDARTNQVIGYLIYEIHKSKIILLNFAVMPEVRRFGVGRSFVEHIAAKLTSQRRTRLVVDVRETNLPAQLFFKACGFRAVKVLRNFYDDDDTNEDAFEFVRRWKPCETAEMAGAADCG